MKHNEQRRYADDLIFYHNANQYHKNWQKKCTDCLAPCCFFSMHGQNYNYNDKMEDAETEFFSNEFVIMEVRKMNNDELTENWGFELTLAQGAELDWTKGNKGLMICPLNINSKCFIYEDRPRMCQGWKCRMKLPHFSQ